MRRTIGLLLLGTAMSLCAQEGQSYLTVNGGETFRSNKSIYKDGPHYGLAFGHWFTDRWGARRIPGISAAPFLPDRSSTA